MSEDNGRWLDRASFETWRAARKPDLKAEGYVDAMSLVRITPDEVQACDGRLMVRIRHRRPDQGQHPPEISAPFFLARAVAQDLARDAAKHNAIQAEEADGAPGWVRFAGLDKLAKDGLPMYAAGEYRVVEQAEPSDDFPPIDTLAVPDREPVTIRLDAGRLALLAAIAKALGSGSLELEIWGESDNVRITAAPSDRMTALLAPIADE